MLEDVNPYSQTIEEYVNRWITEKVVFREEDIITTVGIRGKVKKYYKVHTKDSPNRKWLEDGMKRDLENLIEKYKQG
jgi:LPS O-antigen subunit length determinant protein (WzzB/FepE family)